MTNFFDSRRHSKDTLSPNHGLQRKNRKSSFDSPMPNSDAYSTDAHWACNLFVPLVTCKYTDIKIYRHQMYTLKHQQKKTDLAQFSATTTEFCTKNRVNTERRAVSFKNHIVFRNFGCDAFFVVGENFSNSEFWISRGNLPSSAPEKNCAPDEGNPTRRRSRATNTVEISQRIVRPFSYLPVNFSHCRTSVKTGSPFPIPVIDPPKIPRNRKYKSCSN